MQTPTAVATTPLEADEKIVGDDPVPGKHHIERWGFRLHCRETSNGLGWRLTGHIPGSEHNRNADTISVSMRFF